MSAGVTARRRRIAIIVGAVAVAIALAVVTTPLSTSIGPTGRRVDCGSALTVWSRPDARVRLAGLERLRPPPGSRPAPTAGQTDALARLLDDAAATPGCRRAAAVRLSVAGTLAFLGVSAVFLSILFAPGSPSASGRRQARFGVGLGLIAFVALSVRVAFVLVYTEYQALGFDSFYFNLGLRPFEQGAALFPPAFNALLGAASSVGLRSRLWHHFVNCGIGTVTVVLLGLLGRRFGGQGLGLLVAALAAVYPMLFGADATLMSEPLYLAMVVTTLLLALRARERPTPARFALLGLGIGLASATRGEGLLLVPLLALPLVVGMRDERAVRRLSLLGTTVVVVVVVLSPWVIRNYVVFDEPVLLSNNSSTVLAGANCDGTYAGDHRGFWLVECLEGRYTKAERAGVDFDEVAANNRARDAGIRYARANAGELPALAGVRALRTWGIYSPVGQMHFETDIEQRSFSWQFLGWMELLVLLPLSVIGVQQLRRKRIAVWPLLSLAVLVTVTSALTYGNGRFRMAAEPAVLVLGGAGLLKLAHGFRGSRRPGETRRVKRRAVGSPPVPSAAGSSGSSARRPWSRMPLP
jgi:hypothetical protein